MTSLQQDLPTPFRIGMVIFDGMTNQDFVGPHDLLARVPGVEIDVISKNLAPVVTDAKGRVLADVDFKSAAEHYDLLFIGGGPGTLALMEDEETLAFLREKATDARFVTSVCTGALVLGAAGLLTGYRAATHWAAMEILSVLGATPVDARVVIDRNRITGGGVTAGIDFGLTLIAEIWDAELAQTLQLTVEYNPEPPFQAGAPDTAPAQVVDRARAILADITDKRMEAAQRIAKKK